MTLSASKDELRRIALLRRAGARIPSAAKMDEIARSLCARLKDRGVSRLAGYYPIRDELDVRPVLAAAAASGIETALPVVRGKALPLQFRRWRQGEALHDGAFGVPTPNALAPLLRPEVLLVPGLAFDQSGGRLGYGGGFYDRTLEDLRRSGDCQAIALCYAEQIIEEVPMEECDQRLDEIIICN